MDRRVELCVEDREDGIAVTADGVLLLRFEEDGVALGLADELTIVAERRRRAKVVAA